MSASTLAAQGVSWKKGKEGRPEVVLTVILFLLVLAGPLVTPLEAQRVTFQAGKSADTGAIDPKDLAVVDFNQDGHLDLILTPVNVLAGDGAGALASIGRIQFPDAAGVTAADFDGDGELDLAVTQGLLSKSYGDGFCGSLIAVGIFLGPTMTFRSCLVPGLYPISVQAGDFDRDGRTDLAVASHYASGLRIYRGLGTGTFEQAPTVPGSFLNATRMAPPVDLNGDGLLDLAFAHASGVATYLGNGDGTFRSGGSAGAGNATAALAVGDLNGDGVPDIASVESTSGRLLVGFGGTQGTFSVVAIAAIGPDLSDVALGDIDRDGRLDIVVADKAGGTIRIFFGNGDGTFVESPPLAISAKPRFLAVRDWNEDGNLDLGVMDASVDGQANARVWIALQNGRGLQDVIPPGVAFASPAAGSSVSGSIAVSATALDNVGVIRVEFFADGALVGKSAGPDYVVSWNTRASRNGLVTLMARAVDGAHNTTSTTLQVTVANPSPAPASFFTLAPCRVADTRGAQGPALRANTARTFQVAGACGVPTDAKAVPVALVAAAATDPGDLRLYPAGAQPPVASTINFSAGTARAGNAVIALGTNGRVDVQCDMPPGSPGSTHFVLDVYGYFK